MCYKTNTKWATSDGPGGMYFKRKGLGGGDEHAVLPVRISLD